ncbi:unnamed protein product [Amoebophrya sp. A25]|nr:unnamed protein product [Amoebophrya sp. A25]|eukprot:GSA25T00018618001.1
MTGAEHQGTMTAEGEGNKNPLCLPPSTVFVRIGEEDLAEMRSSGIYDHDEAGMVAWLSAKYPHGAQVERPVGPVEGVEEHAYSNTKDNKPGDEEPPLSGSSFSSCVVASNDKGEAANIATTEQQQSGLEIDAGATTATNLQPSTLHNNSQAEMATSKNTASSVEDEDYFEYFANATDEIADVEVVGGAAEEEVLEDQVVLVDRSGALENSCQVQDPYMIGWTLGAEQEQCLTISYQQGHQEQEALQGAQQQEVEQQEYQDEYLQASSVQPLCANANTTSTKVDTTTVDEDENERDHDQIRDIVEGALALARQVQAKIAPEPKHKKKSSYHKPHLYQHQTQQAGLDYKSSGGSASKGYENTGRGGNTGGGASKGSGATWSQSQYESWNMKSSGYNRSNTYDGNGAQYYNPLSQLSSVGGASSTMSHHYRSASTTQHYGGGYQASQNLQTWNQTWYPHQNRQQNYW